MKMFFIGLLIGFAAGRYYGYAKAHYTVAHECKTLGGFYVNNEVFECKKIKKPAVKND